MRTPGPGRADDHAGVTGPLVQGSRRGLSIRRRWRTAATARRPANISVVTVAELWRRGQVGWPRCYPVAQFPNLPLLLAFAGWGLAAVTNDTAHDVGRAVFTVGLG